MNIYILLITAQIVIFVASVYLVKQVNGIISDGNDNSLIIEKKKNYYNFLLVPVLFLYIIAVKIVKDFSKIELIGLITLIFILISTVISLYISNKKEYRIADKQYHGYMPAFGFKYFGKIPLASHKTYKYSNMNQNKYIYKKLLVIKTMPVIIMLYLGYALVVYDTQMINSPKVEMTWFYVGIIFIIIIFVLWMRSSIKRIRIIQSNKVNYRKLEQMEFLNFIRIVLATFVYLVIVSIEPAIPDESLVTSELVFSNISKFLLIVGSIGFVTAVIVNRYSFFYPSIMRNLE